MNIIISILKKNVAQKELKGALEGLDFMGIKLDEEKNQLSFTQRAETEISADDSPVKIFVIPTDEELVIARDTLSLI